MRLVPRSRPDYVVQEDCSGDNYTLAPKEANNILLEDDAMLGRGERVRQPPAYLNDYKASATGVISKKLSFPSRVTLFLKLIKMYQLSFRSCKTF